MPSGGTNVQVVNQGGGTSTVNVGPQQPGLSGTCSDTVKTTFNVKDGTTTVEDTAACTITGSNELLKAVGNEMLNMATSFANSVWGAAQSAASFAGNLASSFGGWIGSLVKQLGLAHHHSNAGSNDLVSISADGFNHHSATNTRGWYNVRELGTGSFAHSDASNLHAHQGVF